MRHNGMYGQIIDVYTHGGHNWHLLWDLAVGSKKAIVFDDARKADIGALMRYEEGGEETAEQIPLSELPDEFHGALPVAALEESTPEAAL